MNYNFSIKGTVYFEAKTSIAAVGQIDLNITISETLSLLRIQKRRRRGKIIPNSSAPYAIGYVQAQRETSSSPTLKCKETVNRLYSPHAYGILFNQEIFFNSIKELRSFISTIRESLASSFFTFFLQSVKVIFIYVSKLSQLFTDFSFLFSWLVFNNYLIITWRYQTCVPFHRDM